MDRMSSAGPRWLASAVLFAWASCAFALHVVSDAVPDGALNIAAGGKATLNIDINRGDFLQWTWSEQEGRTAELSTQLVWTDAAGKEHALPALPAGQISGNFDAPDNLLGARIEWRNTGAESRKVNWSYYTTAPFWTRPEYFLPAMLPLFLLAAAFYFGRRIDRRRRDGRPSGGATHTLRQETTS